MKKSDSVERTPYQDAKARLFSFHEAGHVVVGHVVGWELLRAKAGRDYINRVVFKPTVEGLPALATNKRDRARRIASRRQGMTVLSAGHVAATIHQKQADKRGYSSGPERRAYQTYWQLRVSDVLFGPSHSSYVQESESDYAKLVGEACGIYDALADEHWKSHGEVFEITKELVEAEIVAAEKRAEEILNRYWMAVEDIAAALHRATSGVLTGQQLVKRLERHGVKSRDPAREKTR